MYYNYVYSDELYHHGVKGMKWGVRKDRYTRKRDKILSKINRINSKNNRNLRAAARIRKDAIDLKKNGFSKSGTEVMKVANDQYKKGIAKRNKRVEKLKGKLNKLEQSKKQGMKSIGKDVGNFIKTHKKQIAMAGVAVGTVAAVGVGIMVTKKMLGAKTAANVAKSSMNKIPIKVTPMSRMRRNPVTKVNVDVYGITKEKSRTVFISKGKSVLRKTSMADYGSKEARDIRTARHLMETTDRYQFLTGPREKQLRAAAKAKRAAAYVNFERNANTLGDVYKPRLTTKSGNRVRRITSSVLKRYR